MSSDWIPAGLRVQRGEGRGEFPRGASVRWRGEGHGPQLTPKGSELNAVGVRLNNNQLTNLDGLEGFLEAVLDDPSELRWIDLSHNRLTRIDPVLLRYPKLSCIYLHGNRVERLSEVDKLGALEGLTKFTLNGNPVEETKDYRMYVSAALKRLRSLDVIAITPVAGPRLSLGPREAR